MSVRNGAAPDQHIKFDFCVGADGSFSIVRRQLMRVVRYAQNFRWMSSLLHVLSGLNMLGPYLCGFFSGWTISRRIFPTNI